LQLLTITVLSRHEEGRWNATTLESLPDKINIDTMLWIDAQDLSPEEILLLKEHFGLTDELTLEELVKEGRRSKIEEHQDIISCYTIFPNQDDFISGAKTNWLAFVVGKHWIITIHKGYSDITCTVYKKISTHGYFALSLLPSTDILLFIFLDLITNEFFLVSDLVHVRLQTLGKEAGRLFREKSKQITTNFGEEIAKSRDQALALRQSIGPLREIVGRITRGEFALVSSEILPRFENLYDRTISLIDVVESNRDQIREIGDILINAQTLTTNNIIRLLTIVSAIFLPLTLIAAICGTNFFASGITTGFYIMIAVMIGIAVSLISIFRNKGWL
jgi:magnesium transporter